jgi:predicted NAD/FAD-binding protein
MLDFPALSLLRFFQNHGFLGVTTHHPWFTVSGGSRSYRDKLLAQLQPVRLPAKVVAVLPNGTGVSVRTEDGGEFSFDRVVIAAHADEALVMLPGADAEQRELLGAFRYQKNSAVLHTDASVMPRRRLAWASWNYRVEALAGGGMAATTHYWMNALQGVSQRRDYFVSINADAAINPAKVLYQTVYEHPVYTLEAMRAQGRLPSLNRRSPDQRVFFCGSYFRHGFHEDAYASAVDLGAAMRPILGR